MTTPNKIILAYPSAGASLLSEIYENNGYHNFGPFFDTFKYSISSESPPAARLISENQQIQIRYTRQQRGSQVDDWTHTLIVKHRMKKFNAVNTDKPSIVTVNMHTFDYLPEAVSLFDNKEVLCLRRTDKFNQLIERSTELFALTAGSGRPIKIDKKWFEFSFYTMLRLELLQNYCIESGKGRLIELDTLLAGTADLGFNYTLPAKTPTPDYNISNIDEITKLFLSLRVKFNVNWS